MILSAFLAGVLSCSASAAFANMGKAEQEIVESKKDPVITAIDKHLNEKLNPFLGIVNKFSGQLVAYPGKSAIERAGDIPDHMKGEKGSFQRSAFSFLTLLDIFPGNPGEIGDASVELSNNLSNAITKLQSSGVISKAMNTLGKIEID